MTDKELEDAIFKAIQRGEGQLVPIDEVGGSESDYDLSGLADGLYDLYVDSCHSVNSLDPQQTHEQIINRENEDEFAMIGRVGFYQWYALSAYFDLKIHNMTPEKEASNNHHEESAADEFFEGPGEHIAKAINACNNLVNILRTPCVINTSSMFSTINWNLEEMETRLRHFIGQNLFEKIIEPKNGQYKINTELIKSKDVIIPLLYASNTNLQVFGQLAKKLCELGAKTVVGIFATRVVPTLDGKEGTVPEDKQVASFSPRFGINL